MSHLIEVAFRGNRKEFFSWTGETAPPLKAGVIVEADRGEDFGRFHFGRFVCIYGSEKSRKYGEIIGFPSLSLELKG